MFFANHEYVANKGRIKDQLPHEHKFGFCKMFKNIMKILSFHLYLKTADLQDLIQTNIDDNNKLRINSLYLYVPVFIPNPATQTVFNESIKNSLTLIFDSRTAVRRTLNTALDYQLDIGSSSDINNRKCLIAAHQTDARTGVPNKANNMGFFDHFDLRN